MPCIVYTSTRLERAADTYLQRQHVTHMTARQNVTPDRCLRLTPKSVSSIPSRRELIDSFHFTHSFDGPRLLSVETYYSVLYHRTRPAPGMSVC
jgi:hypothetical protein